MFNGGLASRHVYNPRSQPINLRNTGSQASLAFSTSVINKAGTTDNSWLFVEYNLSNPEDQDTLVYGVTPAIFEDNITALRLTYLTVERQVEELLDSDEGMLQRTL